MRVFLRIATGGRKPFRAKTLATGIFTSVGVMPPEVFLINTLKNRDLPPLRGAGGLNNEVSGVPLQACSDYSIMGQKHDRCKLYN